MNQNHYTFTILWILFCLLTPTITIAAGGETLAIHPIEEKLQAAKRQPSNPLSEKDLIGGRAYQIGAGDVLNIAVWKDEALSRQVTVLPDGSIALPLVGKFVAAGKTVTELEDEIIGNIRKFLPNPVLDVSVAQVNSMLIYVIGKVRNPGRFPVQADVNVLQALAMAGGLDKHADEDSIKVYREENNTTKFFTFDYDEVLDGEKLKQNVSLRRGDVVVVP